MADFNPDSADKKTVLHALTAKHKHVLSIIENSEPQGFVTWEANTTEKDFYRALQTGLAFLRTDCTDEWCVLGNGVFAEVRAMSIFNELETVEIACGLIYAGNIRRMRVYIRLWPAQPASEFWIGHGNGCVKALAMNIPGVFAHERPQQADPDLIYDPNRMPEAMGVDWHQRQNEEFEAAAARIHHDVENAAARFQAEQEQAAGSPIWRALQGAVDKFTDRLAGQ